MSEIVFILGAGASKAAGGPLMKEFIGVAEELRNSKEIGNYKDDFDRVFNAISELQSVHSKAYLNIGNIESIFAAFEMGSLIKKLPNISESEIEPLLLSTKKLIIRTLETSIKFELLKHFPNPPKCYNSLAGLIKKINDKKNKNICSVITFNYDIALDLALFRNDITIDYCLSENPIKNSVPILKLHGSLNWVECQKCKNIIPWYLQDFFRRYNYVLHDIPAKVIIGIASEIIENQFEHCGEKVLDQVPVIVPPTWNKTSYHNNISNVWVRAANELSDAKHIFISGYSLTQLSKKSLKIA